MGFNTFDISLVVGNMIDYYTYYKTFEDWDKNYQNDFNEHNPILNDFTKEPINTLTNLIYYKLYDIYKDNPKLNKTQKIAVNTLTFGSMFMHSSNTIYGGFIDVLGMIYIFVFFIIKDLIIFKKIKITSKLIHILPIIFILIRLLSRKIFNEQEKTLGNLKLFNLMVGLKVTNEIKKFTKNKNKFIIYNTLWSLIAVLISLKDSTERYKDFYNESKNFLIDTDKSLYNRSVNAPWIIIFIYGLLLQNVKKTENKNKDKFIKGIIFIAVGLLFQESEFFRFKNSSKTSIFQYHSIWHILSAYGLYYIDSYLFDNLPDNQ